ncbi:MAG: ParA family protein [Myxococcota bacterium]|nr:ParA family protein [Myxococcota bacterium]
MRKTKRILIHSPAGGQGKTTTAANTAIMLADRGHRVLAVDACSSKGLQIYFNVQAEYGISELLAGTSAETLTGEIRPNLIFLPGGDLIEAENILSRDKIAPFLIFEKKLGEVEEQYDFVIIDTSPAEDSRLFFALLFYADTIITPIETKRAGVDKILKFRDLLDSVNPRLREHEGKPPLRINKVIPYWFGRSRAKQSALETLQKEFSKYVTGPIGECTGLIESMTQGVSLSDKLKNNKKPRPNEAHILSVYEGLIDCFLTE